MLSLSLKLLVLFIVAAALLFATNNYGDQSSPARLMRFVAGRRTDCVYRDEYLDSCMKLYRELRNPDLTKVHRPPLEQLPKELVDEFTMHGEMQTTYWYRSEAYGDSMSDDKNQIIGQVNEENVNIYLKDLDNAHNMTAYGGYGDIYLYKMMEKNKAELKGESLAVLGTQSPWVEANGIKLGMAKITTLDYTRLKYQNDRDGQLSWRHVFDFFDESMSNKQIEQFENAASYSSVEHSGLGRYGDPLDPIGDVKAVKQMHCMIKPGGLLFLGLPMSTDNTSVLVYNAHRLYGTKRMALLLGTNEWDVLEVSTMCVGHQVHVLRKRDNICKN